MPVTPRALQIVLGILLMFTLVRYVPLPVIIAVSMLAVGSGVPWILDDHFNVGYWVFLALTVFMLLLALGLRLIQRFDRIYPKVVL